MTANSLLLSGSLYRRGKQSGAENHGENDENSTNFKLKLALKKKKKKKNGADRQKIHQL